MSVMNPIGNETNVLNATTLGKGQLSQENFLKMLLAQLKIQNPLNPFDSSTMMQQISQLTGLSSTQKLADSVEVLKASLGASQVFEASQIVGKNVQLITDRIQLNEGKDVQGSVLVPQGIEKIDVAITDKTGKLIKTLHLTAPSSGVLDFSWDGLDEEGKSVAPDFYTISAKSQVAGKDINLSTAASFKVNSVALDRESGKVILNVDGLGGVGMDNIVKIM